MSRMNSATYLHQRNELREDWVGHRGRALSQVSPAEQTALHSYFAPSLPLSNDQAIFRRKRVTAKYPSLPQRAGRAYAHVAIHLNTQPERKLTQVPASKSKRAVVKVGPGHGRITARGLIRPVADKNAIAQVVVRMMREDLEREIKDEAA